METETQLTSVEWLEVQIKNTPTVENLMNQLDAFIKEAKEMEKEQMCKFAYKCHNHYKVNGDFKIEQYYNETFKSE